MEQLPGITYTTDRKNNRIVVVMDMERYGELWQDMYDGIIAEMRKGEPVLTLDQLKNQLKAEGKI